MKNKLNILSFILVLQVLYCNAQTSYVSNGSSTDWATSTAWTPNGVPDVDNWPYDDVTINHDITYTVALTAVSNNSSNDHITVNSGATLTVTSNLSVGLGDIEVNAGGAVVVSGTLFMSSNGEITIDATGSFTANAVDYSSSSTTITNAGTFTSTTFFTLDTDGAFSSTGTFSAGGNVSLTSSGDMDLNGTNTITGNLTATGSGTDFDLNGGTLNVTGNVDFDGDGTVNIAGDMDIGGNLDVTGSGGATIALAGTIDVTSGILTITENGIISGTGTIGWGTLSANSGCSGAIITCDGKATSVDNKTDGGCAGTYGDPAGSPLDLNTCAVGTLPIELLTFDVFQRGDVADIYWATGMELNNDYFEIMGSHNGIDWEVLSIVSGAGNSNEIQNYKETVTSGYNFFKLRQNDYDGAFEDSEIIRIDTESKKKPTLTITDNNLFIKGAADAQLEIYDISGGLVERANLLEDFIMLETTNFKNGIYIIRVDQFNFKVSLK